MLRRELARAGGLRVLALGAHPDDIEIGCGGTILEWAAAGRIAAVRWVVLSGSEPRAREARNAAAAFLADVAVREIDVRSFRDGYFPYEGSSIKDAFEELKRDVDPDVILSPRREDLHQDHRLVAELTWNTFRDQVILEYEIPKYDADLGAPNVFVDLPEDTCRRKVELLLRCFPSQAGRSWFTADTFRAILRLRGVESNAPSGRAEGFTARKLAI
jgi:LmbE family N-acetylglucosaminyl deacetylase